MRMFLAACGCTDPGEELPTSRSPPKSRRKSSVITAAKISNEDPDIAKKLEELEQFRRNSMNRVSAIPIQKRYDDLEGSLNKCKDDLRDLQRKSVTASPTHLRQRYTELGKELQKCKEDLHALHVEAESADSESLQKKYEALQYVLMRYRKDIEEELQRCWTQLKLLHLEAQFASAPYGNELQETPDTVGISKNDEGATERDDAESSEEVKLVDIIPIALERNPRNPRCSLLWKPMKLEKPKHYDELKLLNELSCQKRRLGYQDKPPKY